MFVILVSCALWLAIDGVMADTTTPIPFSVCEYKNAYYGLGQQWQDGPCSSCYCMSTAANVSICRTSCQTYTFVPTQCHLATVAGKCCPEVKCDFDDKCIYKGEYYKQGATWNDGCKSTCTCVSSVTKMVSCMARCPVMNLPSTCQIVPPPTGSTECCPTFNCGGSVVG